VQIACETQSISKTFYNQHHLAGKTQNPTGVGFCSSTTILL
jgi:hypothetical protein